MDKKKLKRKSINIGNKPGIVRNSIVTDPAIGVGFSCFSTAEEKLANSKLLFKSDETRQILVGPVLIPDIDILRKDQKTGEYFYAVFTKEDIVKLNRLRQFNKLINSYTLEHNSKDVFGKDDFIDEQVWIIQDPSNDTAINYGFKDLPAGTLMTVVYVQNKDLYNKIKEEFNGFSVEAYFDYIDINEKYNLKNITKMEKNIFSTISQFIKNKKADEKEKFEMYEFKLATGEDVIIDGDTMEVSINGEIPADGDYELEDGTIITVAAGILVDVIAPAVEDPAVDPAVEDQKKAEEQKLEAEKQEQFKKEFDEKFAAIEKLNAELASELEKFKAENAELTNQIDLYKKMKRAVKQPEIVPTTIQKSENKTEDYINRLAKLTAN